jgi:hypothetical protein
MARELPACALCGERLDITDMIEHVEQDHADNEDTPGG